MPKCKICLLEDELRRLIEEDMVSGLGPTMICNKYPAADLREGNIYTHRAHLAVKQAKEDYEMVLHEMAGEAVAPVLESPITLSPQCTAPQPTKTKQQKISKVLDSIGKKTTGNRVLDDILVLDAIIGESERLLEKVTVPDVLRAIELKSRLLDGEKGENEDKNEDGARLKIGTILQVIMGSGSSEKDIKKVEEAWDLSLD